MRIRTAAATLTLLALAVPRSSAAQERTVAEYQALIEAPQPSAAGPDDPGRFSIEELMAEYGVPGIQVAVIRDFRVQWEKGYGIADVETGAPVDAETMFQAASISKPVTAMATLKAVQDGLFTLDTDINDILTSWHLDGGEFTRNRPVTPRSLHSHTSGLGDGFGFPGYDPDGPIPTVIQVLNGEPPSNTRKLFMEREPMTFEEYSGGGLVLMQLALTDARRQPFADIMRDEVLVPIGMTRSSFEQPISPENDRNAARAHDGEGQGRGPKWHVYPEQAAAGLWTTAGDLARFAVEVQKSAVGESNRVLSRSTVQEMLSPVGVGSFAVGFVIDKEGEGWYFSHGGGNWGFRCTLLAHKVKGYGLAIMTNADRGGPVMAEVARRIQLAYDWDSKAEPVRRGYDAPVEHTEIQLPAETLRTYVGEYDFADLGLTIVVTLEDGRLQAEPTGQEKATLYAETETRFFLKVVEAQFEFTKDASGAVTGAILHQGGRSMAGTKIR